jgi:hypothetical protein
VKGAPHPEASPRTRGIQWLLFAASLLAYAWFHPGGGWNQNARFALVRAIVEEGRLSVDSFLVYRPVQTGARSRLVRSPIVDGEATIDGRRVAFFWKDADGRPVPLARVVTGRVAAVLPGGRLEVKAAEDLHFVVQVPPDAPVLRNGERVTLASLPRDQAVQVTLSGPDGRRAVAATVEVGGAPPAQAWTQPASVASTGDVSFHGGHFHPAKAPGASFLAVPAYLAIFQVERMAGADPDDRWTLTVNAWLTSVLSVGLLAALTVVLVFRMAMRLSGGRAVPSTLTALAFALGTPFLPYATMLYEHDAIAFLLFGAFSLLAVARDDPGSGKRVARLAAFAGAAAGLAVVSNYAMAAVAVILLGFAALALRGTRAWAWFVVGLSLPLVVLLAHNVAAFGTPFTTNYAFEDPQFLEGGEALLGVFRLPDLTVIPQALLSPFRGIFLAAPVLLLGVVGLVSWFRSGRLRPEWWLVLSVLGFFLAFLTTFNGWHGGWGASPRYLVPALPFLAFPAVLAFAQALVPSSAVAAVSLALNLLVVAVDPQAPVGVTPFARVPGLPVWLHSPVVLYEWPIFAGGQASPILEAQRDSVLQANDAYLAERGAPAEARARAGADLRRQIDGAIASGQAAPLLLSYRPDGSPGLSPSTLPMVTGPVSANPTGIHEGWMGQSQPPGAKEPRRNSFNLGELAFPRSRASLLPLLLAEAVLVWLALRAARKVDAGRA